MNPRQALGSPEKRDGGGSWSFAGLTSAGGTAEAEATGADTGAGTEEAGVGTI